LIDDGDFPTIQARRASVGPELRKLFERFLRQVNKLQARQQLEARKQTVDGGGG
jgi:hypothetical protein